jgi:hypothetical protein
MWQAQKRAGYVPLIVECLFVILFFPSANVTFLAIDMAY